MRGVVYRNGRFIPPSFRLFCHFRPFFGHFSFLFCLFTTLPAKPSVSYRGIGGATARRLLALVARAIAPAAGRAKGLTVTEAARAAARATAAGREAISAISIPGCTAADTKISPTLFYLRCCRDNQVDLYLCGSLENERLGALATLQCSARYLALRVTM